MKKIITSILALMFIFGLDSTTLKAQPYNPISNPNFSYPTLNFPGWSLMYDPYGRFVFTNFISQSFMFNRMYFSSCPAGHDIEVKFDSSYIVDMNVFINGMTSCEKLLMETKDHGIKSITLADMRDDISTFQQEVSKQKLIAPQRYVSQPR